MTKRAMARTYKSEVYQVFRRPKNQKLREELQGIIDEFRGNGIHPDNRTRRLANRKGLMSDWDDIDFGKGKHRSKNQIKRLIW
jgi:hypothetical protein